MHILIVEDEKKAAACLHKGLTEHGFVVDVPFQPSTAELEAYPQKWLLPSSPFDRLEIAGLFYL